MYIPPSFVVEDLTVLHAFIKQHSFATLVSTSGEQPVATHMPLLLDEKTGPNGRLIGHMAKANSHWKAATDQQVLAIFHGPHAYISPSWYGGGNVVPTWNYAAVHAYGTLKIEADDAQLRRIVEEYVAEYEGTMPEPWLLATQDDSFVDSLTQAIVGFTIHIDRLEGKWKLSQNHSAERRKSVIEGLQSRADGDDLRVAELMEKELP